MSLPRQILACAVLASALPLAAPAHADDDRFTLRLGAMQADADISLKGNVDFNGQNYDYETDRMGFGKETVPRIEGGFHFGERHRVLFNWFRFDKDHRYELAEDVTFGETTFPAGSVAKATAEFDVASLVYDFALVETDNVSFGLQAGAEWVKLEGRTEAASGTEQFESRDRVDGWAPVVGARLTTMTADDRWRFTVQGQYLDADWGEVDGERLAGDYSGDVTRANALVEYRFTENFGLYAGYDWFKVDVNKDLGGGATGGVDLRFKGPTAGVTLAF